MATPVFDGASEAEIKAIVEIGRICLKVVKPICMMDVQVNRLNDLLQWVICTC